MQFFLLLISSTHVLQTGALGDFCEICFPWDAVLSVALYLPFFGHSLVFLKLAKLSKPLLTC